MRKKASRLLLFALAFALVCLSAAPFALLATNGGHFHMSCSCSVCTAIREDLAVLHAVSEALIFLIAFRIPAARVRRLAKRAATGHRVLLPVALKVRLND